MAGSDVLRHGLAALNARYGLKLQLDERGLCGFADQPKTRFTLGALADGEGVCVHADLMPVPTGDGERLALFERLLALNAEGLGVDGKDGMVVWWAELGTTASDPRAFEDALAGAVASVGACRQRLEAPAQVAAPTPEDDAMTMLQYRA
jgi:hypothetical protein